MSVKKTRTHSKWVIDGCSHFFLLKHKDVNSGKMNPPEKNFLFGHLSFFYADFHQLNIKIFILTISYNHITGLRILFPVYTFHFLSSSCVCSSEGLPAIWGLPVSVSTTLKVILQPTSEVCRQCQGPWRCTFLCPPPHSSQRTFILHTFGQGGVAKKFSPTDKPIKTCQLFRSTKGEPN